MITFHETNNAIIAKSPTATLHVEELYLRFQEFAGTAHETLYVLAPFIRVDALDFILKTARPRSLVVVTTWRPRDILAGLSELALYEYVHRRTGRLYVHPRLHLKLLSNDLSDFIISTANISRRGLGLMQPANLECAVQYGPTTWEERLWILRLLQNAFLVDERYHDALRRHVASISDEPNSEREVANFDPSQFEEGQAFLLNALPACRSPVELLSSIRVLRQDGGLGMDPCLLTRVLHDLALYRVDLGAAREEMARQLTSAFFGHPMIRAFCQAIGPGIFFGAAKRWLQTTCTDMPKPGLRELTRPVRHLFDWLNALGAGAYSIVRPNYSECLVHILFEGGGTK